MKEEEMPVGVMTSFNTERVTWHLPWSCAKVDTQGGAWGDGRQTRHWAALSVVSLADTAPEEVPVSTSTSVQARQAKRDCVGVKLRWQGQEVSKNKRTDQNILSVPRPSASACMWRCACVSSHRARDAGSE